MHKTKAERDRKKPIESKITGMSELESTFLERNQTREKEMRKFMTMLSFT